MTQLEKMLQPDSQYVFYDDQHGFCINTNDVLMLIESERKKGEWIPVSERLPEIEPKFSDADVLTEVDGQIKAEGFYTCYESKPVLICGVCHEWSSDIHGIFTGIYCEWRYGDGSVSTDWRDNCGGELGFDVTAWQPLPLPYQEES